MYLHAYIHRDKKVHALVCIIVLLNIIISTASLMHLHAYIHRDKKVHAIVCIIVLLNIIISTASCGANSKNWETLGIHTCRPWMLHIYIVLGVLACCCIYNMMRQCGVDRRVGESVPPNGRQVP
jgi:predicted Na+-dependent transporter